MEDIKKLSEHKEKLFKVLTEELRAFDGSDLDKLMQDEIGRINAIYIEKREKIDESDLVGDELEIALDKADNERDRAIFKYGFAHAYMDARVGAFDYDAIAAKMKAKTKKAETAE